MDTLRPRSDANRGTGEWLVPGPAHGSNAVRPGVKTQRGLALVHLLRDAGEPSVVRGDDVALLLVSQAVGVGKRAERGTHVLQGLRGRSALCTSPAAIPALKRPRGSRTRPFDHLPQQEDGCFLWDGRRESRAQSVRSFRVRKQTPGFSGGKRWKSQKSRMSVADRTPLMEGVSGLPAQSVHSG